MIVNNFFTYYVINKVNYIYKNKKAECKHNKIKKISTLIMAIKKLCTSKSILLIVINIYIYIYIY